MEPMKCQYLHFTWRSSNGKPCKMDAKKSGYCTRHGKVVEAEMEARKKAKAPHAV